MSRFAFVPVISLSLVVFLASIGIISLPFIIITELLPNKVSRVTLQANENSHEKPLLRFTQTRNAACTMCMSAVTLLAFTVLKVKIASSRMTEC